MFDLQRENLLLSDKAMKTIASTRALPPDLQTEMQRLQNEHSALYSLPTTWGLVYKQEQLLGQMEKFKNKLLYQQPHSPLLSYAAADITGMFTDLRGLYDLTLEVRDKIQVTDKFNDMLEKIKAGVDIVKRISTAGASQSAILLQNALEVYRGAIKNFTEIFKDQMIVAVRAGGGGGDYSEVIQREDQVITTLESILIYTYKEFNNESEVRDLIEKLMSERERIIGNQDNTLAQALNRTEFLSTQTQQLKSIIEGADFMIELNRRFEICSGQQKELQQMSLGTYNLTKKLLMKPQIRSSRKKPTFVNIIHAEPETPSEFLAVILEKIDLIGQGAADLKEVEVGKQRVIENSDLGHDAVDVAAQLHELQPRQGKALEVLKRLALKVSPDSQGELEELEDSIAIQDIKDDSPVTAIAEVLRWFANWLPNRIAYDEFISQLLEKLVDQVPS